jgi:hypothetical protein
MEDLLIRAKHLFVAAMVVPARSSPAKALGAPLAGFPGRGLPPLAPAQRFPGASLGLWRGSGRRRKLSVMG